MGSNRACTGRTHCGQGRRRVPMLHTLMLQWFDHFESLVVPLLKPFVDARQLLDRPVEVQIIR